MAETETNNSGGDPQIESSDIAAFDALADQTFGKEGETSTETPTTETARPDTSVVQKPVTTETPKTETAQQPEAKVTETPEQTEAKRKAALPTQTPKDQELEAIQPPKGISPKGMENWKAIRAIAEKRGNDLQAVRKELETLKPQVGKPDPKIVQENTTLKQELAKYQAVYQNERSPEFMEKFDNKISSNLTSGMELLKKYGLPDSAIANVKKDGLHSVPWQVAKKWISAVEDISPEDGEKLEKAFKENRTLIPDRDKALEEIRQRPEEFQKKLEQERTQSFNSYTAELRDTVTAMTKDIPWCKIQEIPADATPEVRARIESENKFYQESEARFQAALYPKDARTRAEVALSACLSFKLANDLTAKLSENIAQAQEIARLNEKLAAIEKAGVTTRAGINVTAASAKTKVDTSNMTDDDAVEAGLSAIGA